MSLSNFYFLPFLAIVIFLYWLFSNVWGKSDKVRLSILSLLLVASYIFISITNVYYGLMLLIVSIIAYLAPMAIEKYDNHRNFVIKSSVALLLAILGVFKYYDFFIEAINGIVTVNGSLKLFLPLGISFYVFSAICYIVDVYRKKYSANKSWLEVFLYMAFFPKLLAGPIVRADLFFKQLTNCYSFNWANIESGIQIFTIGLFKKMVLADKLSVFVDAVFYSPVAYDGPTLLWAVISYSLQIYFDFSGYSDMAIGVSRMFGFEFPDNFNFPYLSKSVTEFWKRWHISLSSWLQEYLYYSLGGNRKGKLRTYVNLFLTMLIGGLWHGAAWTFVAWGAMHGLALVIHKLFMLWKQKKYGDKFATTTIWSCVSIFLNFIFVTFCWIFFRASSFANAASVIKGIFCWQDGVSHLYVLTNIVIMVLVISSIIQLKKDYKYFDGYMIQNLSTIKGLTIYLILFGLLMLLGNVGNTFFIYGNF